jgi:nanoRNase/pAp phosphatase (c-di-AMP/oligoRNAs hydrolase)
MHMGGLTALMEDLRADRPVLIQAHDFPDHDAVGTAFALANLLEAHGYAVSLGYGGTIQSESLRDAIKALEIEIHQVGELELTEETQTIVVDGFAGNYNMMGVAGVVVAVIDHHPPPYPAECAYVDIRDDYGSCSTILFEYYRTAERELEDNVATALLMGLMMDTAFMTRGVAEVDLTAFGTLFRIGDWQLAARLLRNSLSLGDLAVFRQAIDSCVVARSFAFIALQGEYSAEVMALIADFFLQLREIHFVAVVSGDRDEHRLSVRSEAPEHPCDLVIHRALDGVGAGGGHIHMGGGAIPRYLYPGDEGLRKRFIGALGFDREDNPPNE